MPQAPCFAPTRPSFKLKTPLMIVLSCAGLWLISVMAGYALAAMVAARCAVAP